ncbi:MAG: hypothetical protein ABJF88_09200 [Rhodothermales bacterium]
MIAMAALVLVLPACDSSDSDETGTSLLTPTADEIAASSFTGASSCEVILYSNSGSSSGTITDDDCQYDFNNGASRSDLHFFKATGATTVRVTMTSEAFAPEIILNSESAELAVASPDDDQDRTATFTARVGPGLYQIIAGGSEGGRGDYTVTIAEAN